MKRPFIYFALLLPFLATGCSKQIKVTTIEPAEIERAAQLKRIAVMQFKKDSPGLGGQIESELSQKKLAGKRYFTLIDRQNINKIMKEQKLQYSGLLDESESVKLGELMGAQALITGEVTGSDRSDSFYNETRTKCKDKTCKEFITYNVRCQNRRINMSANIRMVDISRGDIIYSDSFSRLVEADKCNDDSRVLPSLSQGLNQLSKSISKQFVYKITPNYRTSYITLLDDPEIRYNRDQKTWLESGLEFSESNRLDKAESFFEKLVVSTQSKCLVATYNLGTVKEALGNYQEAKTYYQIADELQTKPINEINKAVKRIDSVIAKHQKATEQIER